MLDAEPDAVRGRRFQSRFVKRPSGRIPHQSAQRQRRSSDIASTALESHGQLPPVVETSGAAPFTDGVSGRCASYGDPLVPSPPGWGVLRSRGAIDGNLSTSHSAASDLSPHSARTMAPATGALPRTVDDEREDGVYADNRTLSRQVDGATIRLVERIGCSGHASGQPTSESAPPAGSRTVLDSRHLRTQRARPIQEGTPWQDLR